MTKNVAVLDNNGNQIGITYPKRARGLVKNGRAQFVDDCSVRLSANVDPSDKNGGKKIMNYILFNPREWSIDSMSNRSNEQFMNINIAFGMPQNNVQKVERSFITEFDGGLVECLSMCDWNTHYTRVGSKLYTLEQDTDYSFVFWLNGGENDKGTETCQLQIVFFENQGNSYVYKLNRNYIRPLLHYQGWELYSIPFHTPNAGNVPVATQFFFVAGEAPMAVKTAKEPDYYKDWKDEPDEFAAHRPQRHNLVFEDGWPTIYMYGGNKYSTEILKKKSAQGVSQETVYGKLNGRMQTAEDSSRAFTQVQEVKERIAKVKEMIAGAQQKAAGNEDEERAEEWEEQIDDIDSLYDELDGHVDELDELLVELNDHLKEVEKSINQRDEESID